MESKTPSFAIVPIDYCPHAEQHANIDCIKYVKELYADPTCIYKCSQCSCTENLWLCCECFYLFCGRDQNQHMIEHAQKTNHVICCSLDDLSFWCYGASDSCTGCDYYINEVYIL